MMRLLTLWFGKIIYFGLRVLGWQGSTLPGFIVEKIYPDFLIKSLEKLPGGVVIITGTNGKTTSTKMLTHVLNRRTRVLTNATGSNFIRGMVATIIHKSSAWGGLPYDIAIFELDEAYAAKFVDAYKPRGVIITNIMRDQMDRFGEIDHTAKLLQKVVESATGFVVLNRDDRRVLALGDYTRHPKYYFGVANNLRRLYLSDDELHGSSVDFSNGPAVTSELLDILDGQQIKLQVAGQEAIIKLIAGNTFNYQNAVAACAAAIALDVSVDDITTRLKEVKPAFGRGENINIDNKQVILQLVKNPSGFRHALQSINPAEVKTFMIAINDDYADGRDVSWLWDVAYKNHIETNAGQKVYTSGTRAADMALRLKYDNISTLLIETSLNKCLDAALDSTKKDEKLVIYTTYTAMLAIRKIIAKKARIDAI